MQKWRQWEAADTVDWALAVRRETVIRPLAEQEKITKEQLEDAMLRLGMGRSVLYKLVNRYKQRPQTSSLLAWKRGRGRNVPVLDAKQEKALEACIREFYLTRERPSLAALLREVKRRFAEQQLPAPNYRTIHRRVETLDPRFVMGKREGTKRVREKLGPVRVSTLHAELPLDMVQIDHTLVDVIVVDQEQRKPMGRPWLTLAVDICSRAVLGFSVLLESPSALSVSLVLSHAILPKVTWLCLFGKVACNQDFTWGIGDLEVR